MPSKHKIHISRLKLSPAQAIGHYSIVVLPMIVPVMDLYLYLMGIQPANNFSVMRYLVVSIITAIIIIQKWNELKIERIYEIRTNGEFKDSVLATANKLKWQIDKLDNKEMTATSLNNWKSRDSSKVKINRDDQFIEVSSVFDPFLSLPDFFGINRKNRKTFLDFYLQSNLKSNLNQKVLKQIRNDEKRIENEPEWNFKNTLKRIVAYLLSLGFWAIAIAIWKYDGFSFIVPILAIIGSFYVVFDIYVILVKMRKASS